MSKVIAFVLGFLLLVSSLPAFAGSSDDTILINQTVVLKAGGFPYVITQPGSYKLTGNLVVPADTTGIDIQANGVTLDLNGFSVIGAIQCQYGGTNCSPQPTVLNSYGIFSEGNGNTVRNGHVSGFSYGVKTFGGLVEDVHVRGNWYVGIESNNAVLRKNSSVANVRIGIQAFNSLLAESTIMDNGVNQVVIGGGGVFSRNVIRWYLNNGNQIGLSVVNEKNSSCIYSGNDGVCY